MESFIKISIILSIYGIFKEFRPSEPYLVPYLTEPPMNFTTETVTEDIFPVSTYSSLTFLVIIFLLTDFLRYKIVIIIQAVCAITTYVMLIFCRGIFEMQVMQVVYGLYLAGEVAYFTYIYAKVDKIHFQEVTSYTRSAYLVGKSLSGVASQAALYYDLTSYQGLLWITIGSEWLALIWAILLPSVKRSIYFHRNNSEAEGTTSVGIHNTTNTSVRRVANLIWNDFRAAFTNTYVLKWAFWWVLATCGYYMVVSYVQVLWKTVRAESQTTDVQLNGAVETIYTLLGALASLTVGKIQLKWDKLGELLLAICSLVIAGLLFIMGTTTSVYVAYMNFVLATVIYQTMITVANSEVAKHISRDSYGLVFGVTTFVVYLGFSLFTYIALQRLQLRVRVQFQVYGAYYAVLGLIFVMVVFKKCLSSTQT